MTPFRSPTFRRLWYSSVSSAAAQGMERTATAWLALEAGGGAFAIGLIFATRMLPSLLFGLAAGTIADRADRPRQLLAVAGAAALLMVAMSCLIGAGGIQIWQVVAFSFAARCYLLIAAAYGLTAALVAALRVPQEHRTLVAPLPFRQALRDAARLVIDVPAVRTLILAGLACEVFAFSHMSALPLFAQNVLATGPTGLGTLNAALSVGGAIAVALLSLLPEKGRRKPLLSTIFLVYGLSILVLAATRSLAVAAVVLLEMGMLIAALGVPIALVINGALTVAAATTLLVRAPGYRWVRWARVKPSFL